MYIYHVRTIPCTWYESFWTTEGLLMHDDYYLILFHQVFGATVTTPLAWSSPIQPRMSMKLKTCIRNGGSCDHVLHLSMYRSIFYKFIAIAVMNLKGRNSKDSSRLRFPIGILCYLSTPCPNPLLGTKIRIEFLAAMPASFLTYRNRKQSWDKLDYLLEECMHTCNGRSFFCEYNVILGFYCCTVLKQFDSLRIRFHCNSRHCPECPVEKVETNKNDPIRNRLRCLNFDHIFELTFNYYTLRSQPRPLDWKTSQLKPAVAKPHLAHSC